ncbi:hypothetical protein TRFO_29891 [Tritrichomonas foetus]|uniref:DH domain-containing protein n=1 Tax=Tritrichomonas foetus TaxID=1144522 RepID=A0A1J4JZ72_9EUKA|nr:hypothetical protein TRFO_29891 [Tritrichomonas foetus]|eukprot:OHT02828.1 hypothetical protein TRFO_29891 [Tritrichomonas foetus]
MLEKRRLAIDELIESETKYRDYLQVFLDVYRTKLEKYIDKYTNSLFFGNVELLIVLSQNYSLLFNEEYKKGPADAEIWKCFINTPQTIKIFVPYITNYNEALSQYNILVATNRKIKKIVAEIEDEDVTHQFSSLVVMPVQRMPRYVLLLREIYKCTPEWHPDHSHLSETIEKLNHAAQEADKKCQEAKSRFKLIEFEKSITDCPKLISPSRRFLESYDLGDKMIVHVLNDMVLYVIGKKMKSVFDLRKVTSVENVNGNLQFTSKDKKVTSVKTGDKTGEIVGLIKQQMYELEQLRIRTQDES